jgi:KDO2-lipid IV(A) lauroyltransferase
VVLVTGHFGNWELAGAVFALRGFRLTVPALDHPSARVTRYFTEQRERQGIRVASLGSARGALASALARGEYIGVLGDLLVGRKGEVVKMFGRPVKVPTGYLEVAVEQGAYVVPVFVIRTEGRKHRAFLEPPLEARSDSPAERVKELAQAWAHVMEKYIRRYPDQWILFHRVWRD